MIFKLRRRHRVLAPLVLGSSLLVLGVGLAARPTVFAETFAGREGSSPSLPASFRSLELIDAHDGDLSAKLSAGWRRDSDEGRSGTLWVVSSSAMNAPDPLVYESSIAAKAKEPLPPAARLVGALSRSVPLTATRPERAPYLVIYSLAHSEVLGSVSLQGAGGE